ncbi:MAG: VCBS domain-containing protein, partial [Hyphomicrobiales bacterium]|nr:VCBS domain-containing protein [Hyphomicrobiales bacterium]
TGSVGWTYKVTDAALDFLAKDETLTVTYDVTVKDNNNATALQTVTVTITGTNDTPTITSNAAAASGSFSELSATTGDTTDQDQATGTITFRDVDLDDTHTVSQAAPGFVWSAGTLTSTQLAALTAASSLALAETDSTHAGTGSVGWTYSVTDAALDFLAKNETLTVTYDVTVKDNNNATAVQTVTVTITGTNDAPVLVADSASPHVVSERSGSTGSSIADVASGTLSFTDVDLTNTHTLHTARFSTVWSGGPNLPAGLAAALDSAFSATLHDSTNSGAGSVDFAFSLADNKFDFLAAGETLTVRYNVTVSDGTASSTKPVAIKITGTNDAPVLVADATATHSIGEVDHQTGSSTLDTVVGVLNFTDVDLNDTHTASKSLVSTTWSGGATLPAGLTAALSAALTTTVADSTHLGSGAVNFNFSSADGNFDFLAAGETLTIVYNVTVSDNNTASSSAQQVTIKINGTNDAPVLAADTTPVHSFDEVAGITGSSVPDVVSGTLAFTDADLDNIHSTTHTLVSVIWSTGSSLPAGLSTLLSSALTTSISSDSTGSGAGTVGFGFSVSDSKFDFLAAGETLTVLYNVTVSDGAASSTQPVTITITGTNDAPVISSGTQSAAITELTGTLGSNTADTASGAVTFTDADLSDTHAVSITGVTTSGVTSGLPAAATVLGWLSLGTLADTTGTGTGGSDAWSFSAADKNFDYLAAGETVTLAYTVQVDDHHGGVVTQPVTITITGTNDAPVISSGTQSAALTELTGTLGSNTADSASGAVTFTDADLSDTHTVSITGVSTSGVTSGLPAAATVLGWLSLGTLADTTGTGTGGSDAWS